MVPHSILEKELQTFEEHKEELLSNNRGNYVLIKEDKIIGIFDSKNDAIRRGLEEFGNSPFLVKRIEEIEQVQNFTSMLIENR